MLTWTHNCQAFYVQWFVHRVISCQLSNNIKQNTVYLYLSTALHVSSGVSTHTPSGAHITVCTVSGIIKTVTAVNTVS